MDRTRVRRRRVTWLVAGAVTLATGAATALAGIAPAHADTTVSDGSLHWGFKESFRNYVGNQTAALPPIGALPIAERITLIAPATFDPAGPAVPTTVAEAKRPYVFPAQSGSVDGTTDVEVATTGGVSFNFPSHYFQIQIKNPRVVVSGTTATIYADTVYDVTEDFGNFQAGHHVNTQIPLATSSTVSVTVEDDEATVSATGVTLTPQGAEAVPLYSAGDPLDDFTASAELEGTSTPAQPDGSVSVSKTAVNPAGDTVTVTGTGFTPTVLGTRPPLSGKPAGVYVVFGKFADSWKPSADAPSSARVGLPAAQGGTKWAVLADNMATIGGANAGAIELDPDGSFTATLNVKAAWGSVNASSAGNYGIYTYAGSGAAEAGYETFTPITFSAATAGEGQQQIVATVPEQAGGELVWTIDATDRTVDMGTLVNQGAYHQATGQLKPVVVTDTRSNQANSWSVSGQAGDFFAGAQSFSGALLGWTPVVLEAGAGADAGGPIASGHIGGDGLSVSRVLATGADGHEAGSARLGADLDLRVPAETDPGTYSALLTITAIG